jgi:hypothetical protein
MGTVKKMADQMLNVSCFVLVNIAPGNIRFAYRLGDHIAARFAGKPAISLQN